MRHVASYDPAMRELTALRQGVAAFAVTVGDRTETVRVRLAG